MADLHCSRPPGYTLKLDAIILWRVMSSGKCMVTEEMLKFSMVFEDAAGSKTDYWPLGRGRLIRCCHRRDYRRHDLESSETNHAIWKMHDNEDWTVNYCYGRDYREHGQFFFKKYKAKNINAIELCQTASVVIYNYFVSCLCCDQETSWFRNILADIIGYEDCVFQINLKYYAKPKRHP